MRIFGLLAALALLPMLSGCELFAHHEAGGGRAPAQQGAPAPQHRAAPAPNHGGGPQPGGGHGGPAAPHHP